MFLRQNRGELTYLHWRGSWLGLMPVALRAGPLFRSLHKGAVAHDDTSLAAPEIWNSPFAHGKTWRARQKSLETLFVTPSDYRKQDPAWRVLGWVGET